MTLTVGSLFAGIGGFDLGLERTGGFKTKWQVEIDPYCQRVLAKHWPHVKRYGDIRTVSDVERVDVLCGGFPCQDISVAGPRGGIDAGRSGLWSEYVRLIRMVRPSYIVVENVAALLGRGMARVLADLSGCGYDAEWQSIYASDLGASHERQRVWILAYPMRDGDEGLGEARCFGEMRQRRASLAATLPYSETSWHSATFGADQDQSWFFRTSDGLPDWAHRVKSFGNAIVPQIAEWIGNRILEFEAQA